MLTSFHNSVTVTFLDVYAPNEDEKKDPLLFAENVRILMARSLNVSVTNHSYADVQLLLQAQKMNIRTKSRENMNMEISTLADILEANCSPKQLKYFLNQFHKEAGRAGELTEDQLFKVLNMKRNPVTER